MFSRLPAGLGGAPRREPRHTPHGFKLPSLCAVCHQWGRERVCGACVTRFAPLVARCERCALRVPEGSAVCGACLTSPPSYDAALAAVDYEFPWDSLITRFKFRDGLDLCGTFAQRIVEAHRASGRSAPALLLPVPLSAQRLRERGYNQAWELARRIARELRCKTAPDILLRVRDTPHQLALPIDERADNVRGAFAVEPRHRTLLRGQTIAVIDDVVTTGATVNEIARVLKQCGAARVDVWSLARTPRRTDA